MNAIRGGLSMAARPVPVEDEPGSDTLDFIYEATKDAPEAQLKDADALNTRAIQIFTAGGVILGLTGLGSASTPAPEGWVIGLYLLALFSYIVGAFAAFKALHVQTFRRSLQ